MAEKDVLNKHDVGNNIGTDDPDLTQSVAGYGDKGGPRVTGLPNPTSPGREGGLHPRRGAFLRVSADRLQGDAGKHAPIPRNELPQTVQVMYQRRWRGRRYGTSHEDEGVV